MLAEDFSATLVNVEIGDGQLRSGSHNGQIAPIRNRIPDGDLLWPPTNAENALIIIIRGIQDDGLIYLLLGRAGRMRCPVII